MNVATLGAYDEAAQLLARRVGLRLDPAARRRLARCVAEEANERGVEVERYVAALDADPGLVQSLLNRITVQETAFFRDPVQFEVLARHVLPTLTPPFTIWSAGCANGQEPYSLAMVLEELALPGVRVLTTDISTRALARAHEGVYSEREVGGLSTPRRERFLVPVGDQFSIAPNVRERVEIAHHNLVGASPAPEPGTCPIVFCRNVLIYFSHDEIVVLLDRLAEMLAPGGWLFLGYSESLWQVTDRFELVRLGEAFVYRRRPARRVAPARQRGRDDRSTPMARTARRVSARVPVETGAPSESVTPAPAAVRVPSRRAARTPAARSTPLEPNVGDTPTGSRIVDLIAAGEAATAAGDHAAAVAVYRKCVYLDPDQPVMHVHLALALEAAGDEAAARRSFAVARYALDACDGAVVEALLDGYTVGELGRLLDRKLVAFE